MRLPQLLLTSLLILVVTSSFVMHQRSASDCDIKVTYKVKHTTTGKSDGEIEVTVSRGVAPYQIHWIGVGDEVVEGAKVDKLKVGFYTVHVVDANKCVKIISNIKVESK